MIEFEWDPDKAELNVSRHSVTFEEASTVFFDDYARQFYDEEHSAEEDRFLMLGLSNRSRVLMVVHCERDGQEFESGFRSDDGEKKQNDKTEDEKEPIIRIISARKATAAERAFYDGPLP